MKYCPDCGASLLEGAVSFCNECGKEIHTNDTGTVQSIEPDSQEDDYDGYYDDVPPGDSGQIKEGLDLELIKRIVLIGAGALLIVGLSIAAMYVL